MRIALITPGFSADADDWAIPALQTLALALAQAHELFIFSLRYPAAGCYEWGNFVHRAMGGGQRFGTASVRIWWQTVRAVVARHRQTPFDILHAFWADEPGLTAVLAARYIKRPVVVSIGGGELSYLPDIGYGTQRSRLRSGIIRLSFSEAWAVTAGSKYQMDLVREQGLDMSKAHRVPLGVDTNHFRPIATVGLDRPTIVQAASLTLVKNQALLFETVALIKKELPAVRLLLAGEGPLRPQLQQLARQLHIENNVTFAGAVPYGEMASFFQRGHLYLQSSRHESQGMAVLEAMACGLPVVGTPVGVAADLACLPPTSEPDKLAAQAVHIFSEAALYETYRRKAREIVSEEFGLDKTVQRFLDIYEKLSDRR